MRTKVHPTFQSCLLAAVFFFSLVPGPLLHELFSHHDHCVVHLTPGKEDVIGSMHRHCDTLQLEGPVYILSITSRTHRPVTLENVLPLAGLSPCFYRTSAPDQLRGPPVPRV